MKGDGKNISFLGVSLNKGEIIKKQGMMGGIYILKFPECSQNKKTK
ncbi:unnamed protein product [Paramecium sonneborni]|uniref:Uncharacterized protein n=1 Tax=Paramecium sonneborni TaxID=65129 RepID=A0A8S1Q0Z8_9CILI|nr:unnamed protein product [Paramecium sonneborni]